MERILEINSLRQVTKAVVEAARESVVFRRAWCGSLHYQRKESGADMKVNAQEFRLNAARSHKLALLVAALGACSISAAICNGATPVQDTAEAIWPTKEWQMSTPEAEGMDSKELAKVVDFGATRVLSSTGATPSSRLDSLLVARHGSWEESRL